MSAKLTIEATAWRERPGPRCAGCLGPMPADIAARERWDRHPCCGAWTLAELVERGLVAGMSYPQGRSQPVTN